MTELERIKELKLNLARLNYKVDQARAINKTYKAIIAKCEAEIDEIINELKELGIDV